MNVQTRKMTIREFREDPEIRRSAQTFDAYEKGMGFPYKGKEFVRLGVVPRMVFYRKDGAKDGTLIPATLLYRFNLFGFIRTRFDDDDLEKEVTVHVLSDASEHDISSFINWVQVGIPSESWHSWNVPVWNVPIWKVFNPDNPLPPFLYEHRDFIIPEP